jgi:hypothetical protein
LQKYDAAEVRYRRELEKKYLQAAARLWVPLEPDPPMPKLPAKDIVDDSFMRRKPRRRPVPRQQEPAGTENDPNFI